MELCKGKWKDINLQDNNEIYINNIKNKVSDFFMIEKNKYLIMLGFIFLNII